MRAIFTYPNNLATDYIDPAYVGDANSGFTKRIDELLAGTFKAWEGLDPVSDLGRTTSDTMQTFSKFGNLLQVESQTDSVGMYDLWEQPIVVATKRLIDGTTVVSGTANTNPAVITFASGAEFEDELRMNIDMNGSFINVDGNTLPLFASDVDLVANTMQLRAGNRDGPYLRFYARDYVDLNWLQSSEAIVASTNQGKTLIKPDLLSYNFSNGEPVRVSGFTGTLSEVNGEQFYVRDVDPVNGAFNLTYDQAGTNFLQYQLAENDLPISNFWLYDDGSVIVNGFDADRVVDHQIDFNSGVRTTDPVSYGMQLSGYKRIGSNGQVNSTFRVNNDDALRTPFDWRTRPKNQFSKLYYQGLTFDQTTNAVSFDDELTRSFINLKNFKTIGTQDVLIAGSTIDTIFPVRDGIIWDDTLDERVDVNYFALQDFQGHYTNYQSRPEELNTFFQPAKDEAGVELTSSEVAAYMGNGKDRASITGNEYVYSNSNSSYPLFGELISSMTAGSDRFTEQSSDYQVFATPNFTALNYGFPGLPSVQPASNYNGSSLSQVKTSPSRWYLGAPGAGTNDANDYWVLPVLEYYETDAGGVGINPMWALLNNHPGGCIGKPFVMGNDYPSTNLPSGQEKFVIIPYASVNTGPYPAQTLAPAGTDPNLLVPAFLCYTMVINDLGFVDQLCGSAARSTPEYRWSGGQTVEQTTKGYNPVWTNGTSQAFNFRMHSTYSLTDLAGTNDTLVNSWGYIKTDERPDIATGTIITINDFPTAPVQRDFVVLNGGETSLADAYIPFGHFNQYMLCPYDSGTGVADLENPLEWEDFWPQGYQPQISFECSTNNLSYFADINTDASGTIDYPIPLSWRTWFNANIKTENAGGGLYALQHGTNASAALPGTTYDITNFNYVNSSTGIIEEEHTPADVGERVVLNNYSNATGSTIAAYPSGTGGGTPYEIDTVSLVMPGNRVYGYLNSSAAFVPGATVDNTKYYLAGGAAERYYSTGREDPAQFTITVDSNGRVTGAALVEEPESEGRYQTNDDIALALIDPADQPQPGPSTSEAQDIWDTDDQWMDPGEGEKYWPTIVTPMNASINLNTPSTVNFSQNGTKFTRTSGYTKWTLEVEYPPMTADQFRHFHGIAQAANGQAIPFYFKLRNALDQSILWSEFRDKSVLQLTPRLREDIAVGDTTVLMDGFRSFQDNALETGEVFIGSSNENGALHTAVNTVTSNAYGEARVRIAIPAKTAMPKDTIINKDPEVAIVTLSGDDFSYSVDTAGFYYLTVSFSLDGWK